MAGTGYFDKTSGYYRALSLENWDDYDASSAGGPDWDNWTSWNGSASLPLSFTTGIDDYGSKELLTYRVDINATNPVQITITYGDTIDSSGGAIDSPATLTVNPGDTNLAAINARYFQYTVTITEDSAGLDLTSEFYIESIDTELSSETVTQNLTDIDSSTLTGSIGIRELSAFTDISSVKSIVIQPHLGSGNTYVASGYVAADYFTPDGVSIPHAVIEKGTPNTVYIYDLANDNNPIDCTFDAVAQGFPALAADALGNITQV